MNQAILIKTKIDPQLPGKVALRNNADAMVDTYASGMIRSKKQGLLLYQSKYAEPSNPHVIISALDETIRYAQSEYQLASHSYKDGIYPDGARYIAHAENYPYPKVLYAMGAIEFEKEFWLDKNEPTLHVKYTLKDSYSDIVLEIRPLLAFRKALDPLLRQFPIAPTVYKNKNTVFFKSGLNHPSVQFTANQKFDYHVSGNWYHHFLYPEDADGSYLTEDLYMPLCMQIPMQIGQEIIFSARIN